MNDTVLVSGATGYLGSQLCYRLVKQGGNIIVLTREHSFLHRLDSICKELTIIHVNDLSQLMSFPIDSFFHVATHYGRGRATKDEVYQSNVQFPTEVINVLLKGGGIVSE